MNTEGLVQAGQFQVPNLKDTAAKIRGKSSLTQADIGAIADCIIKTENALSTLKSLLAGIDSPTWFPFIRVGYPEEDPPLVADDNGLRIRGNALVTGTIEASAFNISQPVVVDLVLTNNSPTAGKVAWSSCTVVYQGVEYAITGNNSIEPLIWWVVGAGTFTAGASFTPASDIFLIATNTGGTADTAWNKVANQGIQRSNFMGLFLEGFKIQPPQEVTINLNTLGDTNVIDLTSQAGVLLSIAVYVKTGTGSTPSLQVYVDAVDGVPGAGWLLNVYELTTTFSRKVHMAKQFGDGDGSTAGHYFSVDIGFSYLNSIKIIASCAGAGTGEVYVAATYALKIN